MTSKYLIPFRKVWFGEASPSIHFSNEEQQQQKPTSPESELSKEQITNDARNGAPLNTHHTQIYLSICWLTILIAFVCLMEYAAWAHSLPSDTTREWKDWRAFGRQGTSWRKSVVQGLSVTKTILTIIHAPIITSTLASTLPQLTQRLERKVSPPNLTAAQLFLLADKSWSGAGGWISALKVGHLPWVWWRLSFLTMVAFLGFPMLTISYYTAAEQYWHSIEYQGLSTWELRGSTAHAVEALRVPIETWMHSKPQRNLGDLSLTNGGWYKAYWGRLRGYTDMQTIGLDGDLSFFPPAFDISPLGHFVSLTPKDTKGLVVANTVGFVQTLQCHPMPSGQKPALLDLSKPKWGCKNDCNNVDDKNLCHTRTSVGKLNEGHYSQVASCAWANNVTSQDGVTISVEVAMKINPDYTASGIGLPFPANSPPPYSFRKGDALSGKDYYVEVVNCTMGYIPGHGVVDSVIRKFMQFTPLVVKGAPRPPPGELPQLSHMEEEKLWLHLGRLLNVTSTLPLNFLHESFLESNYAQDRKGYNSPLPVWFGVQHPGDRRQGLTKATSERAPSPRDTYEIDNMVRVNGTIFKNTLIGLVNSTLIKQLDSFFVQAKQYAFIYETDVKIDRGTMPLGLAPLILLLPVCVVLYLSLMLWNTPTWTENLDSWAMFKLGREWGAETTGQGAVELRHSWQATKIPGYVGDGIHAREPERGSEKEDFGGIDDGDEGVVRNGKVVPVIGHLQLGGAMPLKKGVLYT